MRAAVYALFTVVLGCAPSAKVGDPLRSEAGIDAGRIERDSGAGADGGTTEPTDAATPTCAGACEAFAAEGCIDDELLGMCRLLCASSRSDLVVSCLARRSGCAVPEECRWDDVENPIDQDRARCRDNCSQLGRLDCVADADVGPCTEYCATIEASKLEQFNSCVEAGFCRDDSCYRILNPAGASPNVAGCQSACNDMRFRDCLDAFEVSECRDVCRAASAEAINSFIGCNRSICRDASCFWVLRSAAN